MRHFIPVLSDGGLLALAKLDLSTEKLQALEQLEKDGGLRELWKNVQHDLVGKTFTSTAMSGQRGPFLSTQLIEEAFILSEEGQKAYNYTPISSAMFIKLLTESQPKIALNFG